MSSGSLFSYSSLVHAVSGGCGSAVAMTTFFPLDTVRTRLQLQHKSTEDTAPPHDGSEPENDTVAGMLLSILKKEGMSGLYRGLLPVIESLYCSNFVYFYAFHGLKRVLNPNKTALNDLCCGMTAGVINVMATTPLWVVNTRLKLQGTALQRHHNKHRQYKGMMDGLRRVYAEEGVAGLWASCGSSLLLVCNPAIQFMVYESIKRRLSNASGGAPPSGLLVFLAGAIAKALATSLTYPIQLAQARQRHGGSAASRRGLLQLLRSVVRDEGISGLFKGLNAKLLQTVLTAALMFVCYEKIAAFVFALLMGRRQVAAVKV